VSSVVGTRCTLRRSGASGHLVRWTHVATCYGLNNCTVCCILCREEGIAWIRVMCECHDHVMPDLDGLWRDWCQMQEMGEVTAPAVLSAAKAHRYTSGSWLAFSETGPKIDNMWTTIATAVYDGRLQTRAKVSPLDSSGQHVVVVYDDDFSNEQQVNIISHLYDVYVVYVLFVGLV